MTYADTAKNAKEHVHCRCSANLSHPFRMLYSRINQLMRRCGSLVHAVWVPTQPDH